jgi:DMSO/TMAO reductase YedYZ heme-binding membrane subunit
MASPWKPVAVAAGVVAFWMLLAVEVTSLLMKHLPRRLWRAVHLSSFVLFVAATAHGFAAGTDAGNQIFVMACVALSALIVMLTMARVATRKAPVRTPAVPAVSGEVL